MKKFFSKLPVMIVLLVLTVALLGTYIGLLARPVAYGMDYTCTLHKEEALKTLRIPDENANLFKKFDITTKINAQNGKKCVLTTIISYEFADDVDEATKTLMEPMLSSMTETEPLEGFYYEANHKVYLLNLSSDATNEQYKEAVKELKAEEGWEKNYDFTINAFSIKASEDSYISLEKPLTCSGSIVIAVVLGIIEVVLVAFSTLSVVWFVLSKKK